MSFTGVLYTVDSQIEVFDNISFPRMDNIQNMNEGSYNKSLFSWFQLYFLTNCAIRLYFRLYLCKTLTKKVLY